MPRFTITTTSVIDAETMHEAVRVWREFPSDIGTAVTISGPTAPEKPEQPKALAQTVVSTTPALVNDGAVQAGMIDKTPICPDHQVLMHKKLSKFGQGKFYWSCPVKLDDDKYCRAKPQ